MIAKATGREHKQEVKNAMAENRKGENNPFFGKTHSIENINKFKELAQNRNYKPVLGLEVEVTDLETGYTTIYDSIRNAAKGLNSDIKTILRKEKSQLEKGSNKPYRNRYVINIIRYTENNK
jgi:group I intron endonuclease